MAEKTGSTDLDEASGTSAASEAASLFIVSFRHRDELTATAARAGWRPIAARRAAGAELRFIGSGATVAVVDARGALDEGVGAIRSLADPVQANAAALLVLISRNDVARLDEVYAAGATHYLASPFGEAELLQAFRFAARHADRLGAGPIRRPLGRAEALSWSYRSGTLELSPALCRRVNAPEATLGARGAYRLIPEADRRAARAARSRLKRGYGSTAFSHSLPGGGRVAHHLSTHDGGAAGLLEVLEGGDGASLSLRRDPLTGLPDGSATRRWIGGKLGEGRRLALLLIGLDRLQMVNSFYGWSGGDVLLQAAARRIEASVRDLGRHETWIGRLAGTEFLVGLPDASADELTEAAEAIKQAVERRFVAAPDVFLLNACIGGALAIDEDTGGALRRASAALAEAREAGASCIRLLESDGSEAMPRSHRLAEELRGAIAAGQIETLFQPIVCIADGRIDGVEALSRWQHPELGEIGAQALFAAAERAHLMGPLAEHIQQQALALAQAWPIQLQTLRLSVNVSAGEIARPDFASGLLARIDASGFPRTRVTLEVTEEGLIEDLGPAGDALAELRAGGCRVAVDDFGTGYSSLAYLKALPLDYLKLDKRLSQDITGSPRDRIVVRSVIDMARSLGLGVIAEGVETEEQLEMLAAEGCTLYQGFLCSEPVGVSELARLVPSA